MKQVFSLAEISALFHQSISGSLFLTGVSIDSRQVTEGNIFIALKGEQYDGHDFIPQAIANGAGAIITSNKLDSMDVPHIIVPDTLVALRELAQYHRQKFYCKVVALTGSNGKTTVKEMIAAMLPQPSLASIGNFNNHIGLPLSVLRLNNHHRFAVFELGANHIGEIAQNVVIAKPNVTLVNNIAPAHIGEFGSIEGVAKAKGEIHQGLSNGGIAVINEDDDYAHYWDHLLVDKQTLRFSIEHPADVYIEDIEWNQQKQAYFTLVTSEGRAYVQLNVPGIHNVRNAVAAASCALALEIGLDAIVQGLQRFKGVKGRMTYLKGKNHCILIDDTYNANLRSALAALDVLACHEGRRILVLGDMAELGEWTQTHHEQVGMAAKEKGIDVLMTCGEASESAALVFGENGYHFKQQQELIQTLMPYLQEDTCILVKGSRSAVMERIVVQLTEI